VKRIYRGLSIFSKIQQEDQEIESETGAVAAECCARTFDANRKHIEMKFVAPEELPTQERTLCVCQLNVSFDPTGT